MYKETMKKMMMKKMHRGRKRSHDLIKLQNKIIVKRMMNVCHIIVKKMMNVCHIIVKKFLYVNLYFSYHILFYLFP